MKKKLLLGLSMVGIVAAATAGTTFAVLSHQTEVTPNTMTVGNVSVEQNEYERVDKQNHITTYAKTGDLQKFTQNKVILPTVSKNGKATDYSAETLTSRLYCWGEYVTKKEGTGCNGLWDPAKVENVVDKIVMVENTGNTGAYFRTLIAFEQPDGIEYGEIPQGKDVMINVNLGWYKWETVGTIEVDGKTYLLETATYTGNNGILAAGETARPSLLQIALSPNLTSKDMAKFGNDGYEVLVMTQAVQTSEMLTAEAALDAAFGDITTTENPFVK